MLAVWQIASHELNCGMVAAQKAISTKRTNTHTWIRLFCLPSRPRAPLLLYVSVHLCSRPIQVRFMSRGSSIYNSDIHLSILLQIIEEIVLEHWIKTIQSNQLIWRNTCTYTLSTITAFTIAYNCRTHCRSSLPLLSIYDRYVIHLKIKIYLHSTLIGYV